MFPARAANEKFSIFPQSRHVMPHIAVGNIYAIVRPMYRPASHTPKNVLAALATAEGECPFLFHQSGMARVRGFFFSACAIPFICCILCCILVAPVSAAVRKAPPATAATPKSIDSFTITQRDDRYRVNISYPHLGIPVADAELSIWAREQAAAFTESVQMILTPMPSPYELLITYETVVASSKVTSVVFFISASMGGAHPEPGLATFTYTKNDGRRLSYHDLFMEQNGLLRTFADICHTTLTTQLGVRADEAMLKAGTAPDMANFDLFIPTPSGIRIYFPPYQVASYAEGYLDVAIPLEALDSFKPQLSFWDKE